MTDWDDRFVSGEYPRAPEPSAVLRSYEPAIPDGRALDVAAGTGRNAVYLARRLATRLTPPTPPARGARHRPRTRRRARCR